LQTDPQSQIIGKIQNLIQTKENYIRNTLPMDFIDGLREQVHMLAEMNLPAKVSIKVAELQADPMIAYLLLMGVADAVFSMDSDFAVYGGDKCLCVREFCFSNRSDKRRGDWKLEKIVLSTGDKTVIDNVLACLRINFPSQTHTFQYPKFPLFCGEPDPMFRALLCVALGCDVNPGGIKGFGPKTIHDIVKNIPRPHMVPHAERIDCFLKAIVSYKGKKVWQQSTSKHWLHSLGQ